VQDVHDLHHEVAIPALAPTMALALTHLTSAPPRSNVYPYPYTYTYTYT